MIPQHLYKPQIPEDELAVTRVMHTLPGKRTKKYRRRFALALIAGIMLIVIFFSSGNGIIGAWLADSLRTIIGPQKTAQIEGWYLSLTDATNRAVYTVSGKSPNAPWKQANATPAPSPTTGKGSIAGIVPIYAIPMNLPLITPLIHPALNGEGRWQNAPDITTPKGYAPLIERTFFRPDPVRPFAIVTLLAFNPHTTYLTIVPGTTEPGGSLKHYGTGKIPAPIAQSTLLAVFNGGFKYADGHFGLMSNHVVIVPPQNHVATLAITSSGEIFIGEWGVDPRLTVNNPDLVSWRQNAALLINHGTINPLTNDGWAWGGTILNSVYTWRSGIGVTADGTLIYAAGNSLSAKTLGESLQAAGAVMAIQTDINPYWVRAFLYSHAQNGDAIAHKLHPSMQGTGYEYLRNSQRDFFYVTIAEK